MDPYPFVVIEDAASAHRAHRLVVQKPRVDAFAVEVVSTAKLLDHLLLLEWAQAYAARRLFLRITALSAVDRID